MDWTVAGQRGKEGTYLLARLPLPARWLELSFSHRQSVLPLLPSFLYGDIVSGRLRSVPWHRAALNSRESLVSALVYLSLLPTGI